MMPLLILLFGLAGQWLLGLAVATRLLRGRFRQDLRHSVECRFAEYSGLGIVLGIGLTAWAQFVWSLGGGMLGRGTSLAFAGIGFVCGMPAFVTFVRTWWRQSTRQRVATAEQRQQTAFRRVCQCWIGLWIAMAMIQALLTPQKLWDERAIFAIKAAVLFEDRSIHSGALMEPDFVQGHPRYPLLLPLAEQHVYALLGQVDDRISKCLFPLLYAGLVLTTIGVLSRHLSQSHAWLSGVLLATVPALVPDDYGFLCGQADAPVACFHGVAVLYIWDVLERVQAEGRLTRHMIGAGIVAGICSGLAAFTKDEGIAFLMVDAIALTIVTLISIWRTSRHREPASIEKPTRNPLLVVMMTILGCAAVLLMPWFLHRRELPGTGEMNYFGRMSLSLLVDRLSTFAWSVPHLLHRMFWEWREWGLQWWFLVVACFLAPSKIFRSSQLLLLLDVLGALTALLVAGMLAPIRLEEHIGGSSQRFLTQITPVAVLFIVGQLFPREYQCESIASPPPQDAR